MSDEGRMLESATDTLDRCRLLRSTADDVRADVYNVILLFETERDKYEKEKRSQDEQRAKVDAVIAQQRVKR